MRKISLAFSDAISAGLYENTALLTAIRRWRSKTTGHGCQSPFLDVGFDEDKPHLSEIHVYVARSVGSHCGEEVLRLEAMRNVFEFLAVAGEEDGARARPVSYPNNVALLIVWCIARA